MFTYEELKLIGASMLIAAFVIAAWGIYKTPL